MKVLKKILYILILTSKTTVINADNRIVMYLQSPPQEALVISTKQANQDKLTKKIDKLSTKTPSQQSRKRVKNELKRYASPKISGFLALYSGYSVIILIVID